MTHGCRHCEAMAMECRRLRALVDSLRSDLDSAKKRQTERFRKASAAHEASMRVQSRERGRA